MYAPDYMLRSLLLADRLVVKDDIANVSREHLGSVQFNQGPAISCNAIDVGFLFDFHGF